MLETKSERLREQLETEQEAVQKHRTEAEQVDTNDPLAGSVRVFHQNLARFHEERAEELENQIKRTADSN